MSRGDPKGEAVPGKQVAHLGGVHAEIRMDLDQHREEAPIAERVLGTAKQGELGALDIDLQHVDVRIAGFGQHRIEGARLDLDRLLRLRAAPQRVPPAPLADVERHTTVRIRQRELEKGDAAVAVQLHARADPSAVLRRRLEGEHPPWSFMTRAAIKAKSPLFEPASTNVIPGVEQALERDDLLALVATFDSLAHRGRLVDVEVDQAAGERVWPVALVHGDLRL